MRAAAQIQKEKHDAKVRDDRLKEHQLLYLRDHSHKGRNKVQDAWSSVVHKLMMAPTPGGTVYSVAPLQDAKWRQVYWTMLEPVPPCQYPQPPQIDHVQPQALTEDGDPNDGMWVPPTAHRWNNIGMPSDITSVWKL